MPGMRRLSLLLLFLITFFIPDRVNARGVLGFNAFRWVSDPTPLGQITLLYRQFSGVLAPIATLCLAIVAILVAALWRPIARYRRRIYLLGIISFGCLLSTEVLNFFMRSPNPYPANSLYLSISISDQIIQLSIYAAGIPLLILLVSKYTPLAIARLDDQGLPEKPEQPSQDVEVLFKYSTRMSFFNRGIFILDARLGVNWKQFSDVRKYRLAKQIVYDSARRQKRNELARTHLLLAAQQESPKGATVQQQVMGFLRTIYFLIRALFSWLLSFFFIRIRLGKLIRGAHIESKSLVRILETKEAIETAARDLKLYLMAAEKFDGREELFEPER
jgi:hypothetical protein